MRTLRLQWNLFFVAFAFSICIWWIVGAYFRVDVTASLVFFADDTQSCAPASSQVGIHCFADYSATAKRAVSGNPWSPNSDYAPYLAGAYVLPRVAAEFGQVFGSPKTGLFLYLFLATCALSSPCIWFGMKAKRLTTLGPMVLLAGPASIPALLALDRGNNIAFVVPGLLMYMIGVLESRPILTTSGVLLAALFKPQYVLLVVIIIGLRRWRIGISIIAGFLFTQVGSYLLWPRSVPKGVLKSIDSLIEYNTYANIFDKYPPQMSLSRGFYVVIEVLSKGVVSENFIQGLERFAGLIVIAAVTVIGVCFIKRVQLEYLVYLLIAVISMSPSTTWAYYSVFTSPLICVYFFRLEGIDDTETTAVRKGSWTLFVALLLTTIQFPLSTQYIEGLHGVVPTSSFLIPLAWIFFAFVGIWKRESDTGQNSTSINLATNHSVSDMT